MSIRPDQFEELLQHLRNSLIQHGFRDLDERIIDALPTRDRPPRLLLDDYLAMVESEMALGSRATVESAVQRLTAISDRRLEGIVLEVSPEEARLYGGERRVDLMELPDLSETLAQIRTLRSELLESEERLDG